MSGVGMVRIATLIRAARDRGASDLHFGGDEAPALRVDGRLFALETPAIDEASAFAFLSATLASEQLERLAELGNADGAAPPEADGRPYRIHAFRHLGGTRVAIRLLAQGVPDIESLGLPPAVGAFAERPSGLVLLTGPKIRSSTSTAANAR